ncbi:DUF5367 family protein [Haloarchaeobius amylolyticus]|uniref:DUF5367 family protein n=1 Tax=Haloarchaeobius amylolyticus TaxID=1198296 RepID=UPI00227069CE|nr:DUF5367 family protein [Haloarchaeobius amylolyticus]
MHVESTARQTFARKTLGSLVLWGLTVWLVVAIMIRLVGHVLLSPATPLVVAGFFVSVVPMMALVTYPVYRWAGIPHQDRATAAALLSIPGMFLDVLLVLFAGTVFPQMEQDAVVVFGAILLFGYAVVLLTGFVPAGREST